MATALRDELGCTVRPKQTADRVPTGLAILRKRVPIQIDVTPVLRGSVFPPERRALQPAAIERFGFLEMQTLDFADLLAGKLVAALDRQHPRDLFDVSQLLAAEGITDALWSAFLVYLVAANRPIAEMLAPRRQPLEASFVEEFAGMTEEIVEVQVLVQAREEMIAALQARLTGNVCEFLLSVEREAPQWQRLDLPAHVPDLPAIRWKLLNLGRRSPAKRRRRAAPSWPNPLSFFSTVPRPSSVRKRGRWPTTFCIRSCATSKWRCARRSPAVSPSGTTRRPS